MNQMIQQSTNEIKAHLSELKSVVVLKGMADAGENIKRIEEMLEKLSDASVDASTKEILLNGYKQDSLAQLSRLGAIISRLSHGPQITDTELQLAALGAENFYRSVGVYLQKKESGKTDVAVLEVSHDH